VAGACKKNARCAGDDGGDCGGAYINCSIKLWPADQLLLKLGAAKKEAGNTYKLVRPEHGQPVTPESFTFALDKERLRTVRGREGHYLLRSNLSGEDPAQLWQIEQRTQK